MTEQKSTTITPEQIIDILVRRRWIILLPLCFTMTVGLYFAVTLPRVYSANTTILVQPQEVPGSYVKSIVSSEFGARISAISQQVLSRSNLEKIMEQYGLFTDEKYSHMYPEDKIKNLKESIAIDVNTRGSRRGSGFFSISFKGGNPEKVMRITNALASYFMDENLKLREAQAIGTSDFIDAELGKTREKLILHEERLSVYRKKYLGGLPNELESNLRTLDRLQAQLTDQQTALRQDRNALSLYEMQAARLRESQAVSGNSPLFETPGADSRPNEPRSGEDTLERAEQYLKSLLLKYTDKHPDVVKTKKIVAMLKEKKRGAQDRSVEDQAQESFEGGGDQVVQRTDGDDRSELQNVQIVQLKRELQQVVDGIKVTKEKMKVYQKLVEDTPKREQELVSIQRDYQNLKNIYNSLLDRKLEAELAVNMEKKQKGEQFRVIDYARLPEKPVSPDMRKLLLFSMAGGMGVAGGIIFLLEFLNPPIRREDVIEKELGLTILASIPPLEQPGLWLKKRFEIAAFLVLTLYLGMLGSVFALFNLVGVVRTLDFIGKFVTI